MKTNETENVSKLIPLMMRLPPELHAKLKDMAENDRRSLNTMIILLLESKVAEIEQNKATVTIR